MEKIIKEFIDNKSHVKIDDELVLHFTHNDGDAIGCALVVERYYALNLATMVEHHFSSIQNIEKNVYDVISKKYPVLPKTIIFSDISISEQTADLFDKLIDELDIDVLLIDHHNTNKLNNAHSWAHVTNDKTISAALYMDDILSSHTNISAISNSDSIALKLIIQNISDYDTWEWKNNPKQKEFYPNAFRNYECKSDDLIQKVNNILGPSITFKFMNNHYVSTLHDDYPRLYPDVFEDLYMKQIKSREYAIEMIDDSLVTSYDFVLGHIGYLMMTDEFTNDKAHWLLANEGLDIVISVHPVSGRIEMRSSESCEIDCGEYCKNYLSGGGHKHAAGGRFNPSQFKSFTEFYYSILCNNKSNK